MPISVPKAVSSWPNQRLEVYLYDVTDSMLAGLLPALPTSLFELIIDGEQRQHHKLVTYRVIRGRGTDNEQLSRDHCHRANEIDVENDDHGHTGQSIR